jgi:hypothetical protein
VLTQAQITALAEFAGLVKDGDTWRPATETELASTASPLSTWKTHRAARLEATAAFLKQVDTQATTYANQALASSATGTLTRLKTILGS